MDKTPFSKKCEILHDFYMDYSESNEYKDFVKIHDLGLPAALLSFNGSATLTDVGIKHVEETWADFCELLKIDHHGEYEDLDSLIEFANE